MIRAAYVPLPSPPFLGGEGLGVRGERSLDSGSGSPPQIEKGPIGNVYQPGLQFSVREADFELRT